MFFLVRYIRGYRKQHVQQAVPKTVLEDYRKSELSANTPSPYTATYSKDELQAARRFKSVPYISNFYIVSQAFIYGGL